MENPFNECIFILTAYAISHPFGHISNHITRLKEAFCNYKNCFTYQGIFYNKEMLKLKILFLIQRENKKNVLIGEYVIHFNIQL